MCVGTVIGAAWSEPYVQFFRADAGVVMDLGWTFALPMPPRASKLGFVGGGYLDGVLDFPGCDWPQDIGEVEVKYGDDGACCACPGGSVLGGPSWASGLVPLCLGMALTEPFASDGCGLGPHDQNFDRWQFPVAHPLGHKSRSGAKH